MTEALPAILAEIAAVAGEAAAIAISSAKGGTRVYIPAKVDEAHWLAKLVGIDAAKKICQHFAVNGNAGDYFMIPLYAGGTYKQMMRKIAERIHAHDQDDRSSTEIARAVGIHKRTVHRHRGRHRGRRDPRQGNLKL